MCGAYGTEQQCERISTWRCACAVLCCAVLCCALAPTGVVPLARQWPSPRPQARRSCTSAAAGPLSMRASAGVLKSLEGFCSQHSGLTVCRTNAGCAEVGCVAGT
jgi:hypothetical protein